MKVLTLLIVLHLLCVGGLPTLNAAAAQPNVLLIVSEDNGPELGCYGDSFARTPNLDRLASEGVRFENAFVTYSVCSPSRASFLTGLYSHENGQIGLATHKFSLYRPDTPNIVTLLQAADYKTGLIGKLHVNPESAFPFDLKAIPSANFQRRKDVTAYVAAAEEFWQSADEQPWFLSVNFPDAHLPFLRQAHGRPEKVQTGSDVQMLPWVGADSERLREVMADYYNCMARLDDGVGQLLTALQKSGAADNTLVIYIGDHGAQFPRGKGTVYEAGLRIPMIVRWPGRALAGTVRQELVSTVDILPTVLNAVDRPIPRELSGRSLKPLLTAAASIPWREYVFAMTTGSFPGNCFVQHSVRDRRFKLISNPQPGTDNLISRSYLDESHPFAVVSAVRKDERRNVSERVERAYTVWEKPPRYEFYDLQEDPYEWNNLADSGQHSADKDRLIKALHDFQRRTRDPLSDADNVNTFVQQQLSNRDLKYRRQKNFEWDYVEDFRIWREQQAE